MGIMFAKITVLRMAQRSICVAFRNQENSGLVALDFCNRRSTNGARSACFDLAMMLQAIFLGNIFRASDRELEKALYFRVDFILLYGTSITSPKTDRYLMSFFE